MTDVKTQNEAEREFLNLVARRGKNWAVHRHGWPDFLLTINGQAMAVEVKAEGDRLREGQELMFAALEKAGVEVRVWWAKRPDHLIPWRKFRQLTHDKRNRVGGESRGVRRLSECLSVEAATSEPSRPCAALARRRSSTFPTSPSSAPAGPGST